MLVFVGGKFGPIEDCLGELGDNLSLKGEKGGLGVWDLVKFNYALLEKWHWNLFHHHGELWVQVLDSKYGSWRNLDETRRNNRVSLVTGFKHYL